ncbi:hypothetical protein ACHWQZ_G014880 [Mnemiopsis leidyi]
MKVDGNRDGLLYIGLNQDHSCFACGDEVGVRIFNCDPVKQLQCQNFNHGIGHVEMLFRCCYLALVGGGSNPTWDTTRVVVWEDQMQRPVCEIELSSPVLSVKLKRDRIVVATLQEVYVYTLDHTPVLLLCYSTSVNPAGLVELCTTTSLLAFPGVDQGQVSLVSIAEDAQSQMRMIPAHTGPLAILTLNMQGTMLATASDKGTLIRIFDTQTCLLLYELRRGTNKAHISSVAFNRLSNLLCVTSDTKTLHIFSLDGKSKSRSVTKHTLSHALPSVCCFGNDENTVIVISSSGYYFKIRWNDKGETFKEEQFKFMLLSDD